MNGAAERDAGKPWRQSRRGTIVTVDAGSGSVLAVAVIAGVLCVTAMALPLYLVFAEKQALAGAADAAALAAADVRVGFSPGEPCAVAARVAAANGGSLASCSVDGLVVTVRVTGSVAGFGVGAVATAGPPAIGRRTGHE